MVSLCSLDTTFQGDPEGCGCLVWALCEHGSCCGWPVYQHPCCWWYAASTKWTTCTGDNYVSSEVCWWFCHSLHCRTREVTIYIWHSTSLFSFQCLGLNKGQRNSSVVLFQCGQLKLEDDVSWLQVKALLLLPQNEPVSNLGLWKSKAGKDQLNLELDWHAKEGYEPGDRGTAHSNAWSRGPEADDQCHLSLA